MARNSFKQYAAHRAAVGLSPLAATLPPPPATDLRAEILRRAERIQHEAGAVLAVANQTDPIAARCLRMIGQGMLSDVAALRQAAGVAP